MVVAAGVLVSWFVSMTLTPMLCSRFLEVEEHHQGLYYWLERSFRAMESFYAKLLALALSWRWTVVGITWLTVVGCVFFLKDIGKEFSPEQDESRFMVMVRAPLGSGIDYVLGKVDEVESVLARHNDVVQSFFIGVGTSGRQMNEAWGFARMTPKEARAISQQDLLKELGAEFAAIPGVRAFPIPIPTWEAPEANRCNLLSVGPTWSKSAAWRRSYSSACSPNPASAMWISI
jgi:HAE1 family hydrophobic/amphiphilic exporter-1